MAFDPVSAGIVAGAGILNGIMSGSRSANQQNATRNALNNAINTHTLTQSYAGDKKKALTENAKDALDVITGIYGDTATAKQNYDAALAELYGINPYEASEFSYDKDISDFYDPAYQLSVNMANDGIENSRALGGGLFSSATADALNAQNNVLATNMYNDAKDAMNADRTAEQSTWSANEAAKQAAASSAQNLATTKMNAAGTAAGNVANGYNNYYNTLNDAESNYYNDLAEYYQGLEALQAQMPGETHWYNYLGF